MFNRVLLATDFQPSSQPAFDTAVRLVKQTTGAELFVLHVVEPPAYAAPEFGFLPVSVLTSLEDAGQRALDACVSHLRDGGVRARARLATGLAWQQIIDTASEIKAEVIVLGTHGRHGLMHAVLGSVAERVVQMSPIPVLTVRADAATSLYGRDAGRLRSRRGSGHSSGTQVA